MAEAKLDIGGSSAVAQREIDKLTKGLASAREEIRRLNATTKESKTATDSWSAGMERLKTQNDRWAQGMAKMASMQPKRTVAGMSLDGLTTAVSGLGKMAGTLGGIGAAVGVATAAYSRWNQKIEEVIQNHTDLSMSIVRTLAESGKLSMGPEVEKWARSQKGVTPQQAMAAVKGVHDSGETLSHDRTMAVATEISKLAPTGIDLTRTGALSADVADIVGEGVSAKNVANMTVGLKQQLREKTDIFSGPKFQKQIERLKRNTGMNGEDALAYAVAAAQGEVGAEGLSVAAMKPGERNLDQRKMYKDVFSPENIATAKASLERFKSEDLAAKEVQSLGAFRAGREAIGEQQILSEKAATESAYGPLSSERERVRKMAMERAWQRSGVAGAFTSMGSNSYVSGIGDALFGQEAAGIAQVQSMRANQDISGEKADELIAALRDAAAASRAAAKSNSSRNVDAHTE